ncbi:MAG TPA: LPS export ABC transporter ATP-binding protein [Pseudomonadales bacterium]|jgi:lipopolysaccharide export system ATP-binding protein|nr:LPS export ABC transporter ATP-binding protein [Pseudomonadales bacterium]HMU89548.1 LPS export ABC transporter ATP-binding protein [Pseudomonadales bacterium]HMY95779.1 LPS export ABC transporter ATP-binding protein [Pseudomonadales bacterium]HMZ90839.1 LPS export ABC transporter ATP-binding protein [Pseudomonadales bacterium]HNC75976.1 LPS export ABC transporter ATP-binding protein [Pseudomonadales bacterium]
MTVAASEQARADSCLNVSHLCKRYQKRQVVRDVSLTLRSGEIVGLLGPNGAGKTTCFYMIIGLVRGDGGTITLDGQEITHLPMHRRARRGLGYLPQEPSVFRQMSVADNILAVLETRARLSRSEQRQRLDQLLDEFNIAHLRNELGMSLSGGERRRVEIARALAVEPRFMLLDEPFAGVDPISMSDIKAIVRQLQQRSIGVLITDHNVRETLDICERAYIVSDGGIIAEGDPAAIMQNRQVREVYLGKEFSL